MTTGSTFKELGVSKKLIQGLEEQGIKQPTEIQQQAIPYLLEKGEDFIGQAQTGTGKTAAFGVPILQNIDPTQPYVQALILAPTRELSQQIAKQLFRFTKYTSKIFTEAVYGGEKIDKQIKALDRPTHIIVATPGRLIDLLEAKAVNLSRIKTLVLDEADEMLSMGFKEQLDRILKHTMGTRKTWLFSATMPQGIQEIIKGYMSPTAKQIKIDPEDQVNRNIKHLYCICTAQEKNDKVEEFLEEYPDERGVIFCRTKAGAIALTQELEKRGYDVGTLQGDMSQLEREKVMRAFKKERLRLLIATDVAARGIDIPELSFVLHYQLPDQVDYYTHRSGRTARAGNQGISFAFIHPHDRKQIKELERKLHIKFYEGYTKPSSPWANSPWQ